MHYGAGLSALVILARRRGYLLAHVDRAGAAAIFVRSDLVDRLRPAAAAAAAAAAAGDVAAIYALIRYCRRCCRRRRRRCCAGLCLPTFACRMRAWVKNN